MMPSNFGNSLACFLKFSLVIIIYLHFSLLLYSTRDLSHCPFNPFFTIIKQLLQFFSAKAIDIKVLPTPVEKNSPCLCGFLSRSLCWWGISVIIFLIFLVRVYTIL